MSDLPPEMRRNGRPPDNTFAADENLYLRFQPQHLLKSGKVDVLAIRCPNQSVNRSKHGGRPEHVLLPSYSGWGAAQFTVEDVPQQLESGEGAIYRFGVEHAPEDDNYFHSEVRAREPVSGADLQKVPDKVRRDFRRRLAERLHVAIQPASVSGEASPDYWLSSGGG